MKHTLNFLLPVIGLIGLMVAVLGLYLAWRADRARVRDSIRAAGDPPRIPDDLPHWLHESVYRSWRAQVWRTAIRIAAKPSKPSLSEIELAKETVEREIQILVSLYSAGGMRRRRWRRKLRSRVLTATWEVISQAMERGQSTKESRYQIAAEQRETPLLPAGFSRPTTPSPDEISPR